MSPSPAVLAINCSPTSGGRTRTALEAVLAGAAAEGAAVELVELAADDGLAVDAALEAIAKADAFVFGSPMYRASYAAPFKVLMDAVPRGMWGETSAPLTGRAVAIVATAASDHHFLGPAAMRDVLCDFFAAHLVSPGLYVPASGFDASKQLERPFAARAELQGRALVELAGAIEVAGSALAAVVPQA